MMKRIKSQQTNFANEIQQMGLWKLINYRKHIYIGFAVCLVDKKILPFR